MTLVLNNNGVLIPFEPADPDRVTMYVCGPTVYDVPHLGNLRSAVVFDVLFRVLRRLYGEHHVAFARNYTDIDDKIIDRANQLGAWPSAVTEPAIAAYESNMKTLHVLPPTLVPRVSEEIEPIIDFIGSLLASGDAYVFGETGAQTVLFDRQKNPGFFLNRDMDPASLRGENVSYKRHPHDFVLWKPVTDEKPQGWSSPWGLGRPGWHIECSAMILGHLGETIDIHGGGGDLKFPHHENECAQSMARNGQPLARYWLHNGMLHWKYDGPKLAKSSLDGKMSKSAGNMVYLDDLDAFSPEAIRYFLLSAHYRQPLVYGATKNPLMRAEQTVKSLKRAMRKVGPMMPHYDHLGGLLDDLNTPRALAEMNKLSGAIHGNKASDADIERFISLADVLGLHYGFETVASEYVIDLRAQRDGARQRKDFAEADRLRDLLVSLGEEVNDAPLRSLQ